MRHDERKVIGAKSRYAVGRAEKAVAAQKLAHKECHRSSAMAPSSSSARAVDIRRLRGPTTVRASEGFFTGFLRSAPRVSPRAPGDENRRPQRKSRLSDRLTSCASLPNTRSCER